MSIIEKLKSISTDQDCLDGMIGCLNNDESLEQKLLDYINNVYPNAKYDNNGKDKWDRESEKTKQTLLLYALVNYQEKYDKK